MLPRWLVAIIAPAVGISAWILGGVGGLLYAAIYLVAGLAGLPFGLLLFGKNPAGWVAGALIGYALTAFAIWIPIAVGIPSTFTFILAWLGLAVATWFACRHRPGALVRLPPWNPSESAALAFVLLLTLAVAVPPFANVGKRDNRGNRYYRAYFTADFVWHTALTAELTKFAMPPRNPYLANRPIHYYWAYFLLPAAVAATGPPPVRNVELCLKVNALMTGLLFMSAVFVTAWTAVPRAAAVATAVVLALIASSAEGVYALWDLWSRGAPLAGVKNLNIDAVTNWTFQGHRIDGLQRCLWYVPQHSMAYALGLVALAVAAAAGAHAPIGAIIVTGLALGASVAMNPFVGGIFAIVYGASILIDIFRSGNVRGMFNHILAAIPAALAVIWCSANQMVEGAGSALQFGFSGPSRHAPLTTLVLSLGPVLLPAIAGLAFIRHVEGSRLSPSVMLAAVSLCLLYFVHLAVDAAWVGFRAGQMMLVALPALIAAFLAALWDAERRALAVGTFAALFLTGLPTAVIDEYNAQDIHNLSMGPGFPWTIVLTRPQQDALGWIRNNTAPDAIVQMDAKERERSTWSLIPSFGERRMAAGLPISLLNVPEYRERSDRVHELYATDDVRQTWQLAHNLRIDYLYADDVERRAHPTVVKFDRSPDYFEVMFRTPDVGVYKVK